MAVLYGYKLARGVLTRDTKTWPIVKAVLSAAPRKRCQAAFDAGLTDRSYAARYSLVRRILAHRHDYAEGRPHIGAAAVDALAFPG